MVSFNFLSSNNKWQASLLGFVVLLLTGCQTTQTQVSSVGPAMTGPSTNTAAGTVKRAFPYNSNIFLDVAIPVFDPGIPLDARGNIDDQKVAEEDIWPQVRRLEANRFAIDTKKALAATKAFGAINVTPDASVSADVYVLGKINYSDTETVRISVRVMDATNDIWGEKSFEHQVGQAFYRDALRKNQNPYAPIFNDIAAYVYDLLIKKSEKDKQTIQQVSDLRYAAMYSPEAFGSYLTTKRKGFGSRQAVFQLTGAPAEQDAMLQRVRLLQNKDEQFVDTLQDSYEAFYAETSEAYLKYQRETLAIAADIRKKKAERTAQQLVAAGGAVLGIMLAKNSNSKAGEIGAIAAGTAAVFSLSKAIETNHQLSAQRDVLSEMGQNLDIKVTPQVVELNDQTIELQGTALEQYTQLRQRLLQIYQLEATPDTQL
ncbi:hypothetical protein ACO1PK_12500 [Alishewanella sp. d11]|uniref:hypothetical protein n=1 Tax=Alishewanella sp. d11 TaxID=3414030 RepID=UPI003BF888BA